MQQCVITHSGFPSSFYGASLSRHHRQFIRINRQFMSIIKCCNQAEDANAAYEDGKFPQLSPKPKAKPIDEKKQQEEDAERQRNERLASFLQNFDDKPEPTRDFQAPQQPQYDPSCDTARQEMRRRLLHTEPPQLPADDEDRSQDIEFDMFEHLVLTIRHILHLRYNIGEKLDLEDELILVEEAIPYHPDREFKVGCGIDYIKVDVHPEFGSRCFFIVRKDQSEIDFSYRKCMMGLARAKQIPAERARDLIYFFKTTNGQTQPRYFSLA